MSAEDEDAGEDFASMLEESLEARSFETGETVEGRIVSVGRDVAFIDIGGKGEATIDLEELQDDEGDLDVEVGDFVQGVIVSTRGGIKLSHKLARGAATRERLQEAYRAGLPVEGKVDKAIRGGYEVRVAGQRGFCPISQIDKTFTEDPSVHEGEVYTFRITEFSEEGRNLNLVVSRRALLEEEEREQAEVVRRSIVSGADLPGRVVSLREYGAFVDLGGGIQGLLHVSEMGWARVKNPGEVVQPGDEITVKVLRVDKDGDKISLGLKQLQDDPWNHACDTYEVGQLLMGRVTRVAEFGAFVELEPGIEALAHVSTFPPTGKRDAWKGMVPSGASVAVEVLNLDLDLKRIGVAVVEEGSVRAKGAHAAEGSGPTGKAAIATGAVIRGKIDRHESYGVFVFLAPGRTGLMPLSETGVERGDDLRKTFPIGSEVEVMVVEVDPSGKRIRLSRNAVIAAKEKDEAREYAEKQERETDAGFGSLADKLKAAIRPRDES